MTAAPTGLVLGLANGGILQENCSATLYNTAAKPVAFGISELLDGMELLKLPADKFLADRRGHGSAASSTASQAFAFGQSRSCVGPR